MKKNNHPTLIATHKAIQRLAIRTEAEKKADRDFRDRQARQQAIKRIEARSAEMIAAAEDVALEHLIKLAKAEQERRKKKKPAHRSNVDAELMKQARDLYAATSKILGNDDALEFVAAKLERSPRTVQRYIKATRDKKPRKT